MVLIYTLSVSFRVKINIFYFNLFQSVSGFQSGKLFLKFEEKLLSLMERKEARKQVITALNVGVSTFRERKRYGIDIHFFFLKFYY